MSILVLASFQHLPCRLDSTYLISPLYLLVIESASHNGAYYLSGLGFCRCFELVNVDSTCWSGAVAFEIAHSHTTRRSTRSTLEPSGTKSNHITYISVLLIVCLSCSCMALFDDWWHTVSLWSRLECLAPFVSSV